MLLRETPARLDEVRQILIDIRRDDLRAHETVRQLRSLLKKRELRLERMDINVLAADVLQLVRHDAQRRGISLRTTLDSTLPSVCADPVHLQQVLLNLIVNAMDSLSGAPADARLLELQTSRHDAASVVVAVLDTGGGLDPKLITRLFDSFVTTKPEGMGLGLSIARGIVQAHGGALWAHNGVQGGAVFKFTVPTYR
jgi:signal transduction histidine kinase